MCVCVCASVQFAAERAQLPAPTTTTDDATGDADDDQPSVVLPSVHTAVLQRIDILHHRTATATRPPATVVADPLPADNRGFQMLQRTGWTPGDTLGRNGGGLDEPISVTMRHGRRGLGDDGATAAAAAEANIGHPSVFTYLRQFLMQNGAVRTLVFGPDFSAGERRMITG